ncbi:MAG TPA: DUF1800 family protein [Chthoniobacterales bacterium]
MRTRLLTLSSTLLFGILAPSQAATVIIDNAAPSGVTVSGAWTASTFAPGFHGSNYLRDGNTGVNSSAALTVSGDIGTVTPAGSSSYDAATDRLTVSGSGKDIWGNVDAFHFVRSGTKLTGDGTITARVESQQNTDNWAKAGVMIRETTAADSKQVMTAVTPVNGVCFQRRPTTAGASINSSIGGLGAPRWVRLVRAGDTFTSFYSSDGTTWTQISWQNIAMAADVEIGLCVTSHKNGTLSQVVFSNVTLTSGAASAASSVRLTPTLSTAGQQRVYLRWPADASHASNASVAVVAAGGATPLAVNQRVDGGKWNPLGAYPFNEGTSGSVLIANTGANGEVAADAARWIPTLRYEAETIAFAESSAAVTAFTDPAASNGAGERLAATAAGDFVAYTLPAVPAGTYQVKARYRAGGAAGLFQLAIDNADQGAVQDQYGATPKWIEADLGRVTFGAAGDKVFKFTVTGKNAASTGYELTFDYLELQPFTDTDGDGMPDAWEIDYGLDPDSAADGGLDTDGDGQTNLQEYQAGTNPNPGNGNTGTVTLSADVANAYEKEGIPARVKITRTGGSAAATIQFTRSGTAGAADYATKDANGGTLNGSILLPAGANSVDVVIQPAVDAVSEYPEPATLTLTPGAGYSVGAANSATVTLNDATNVPANEKLYVAALTPAPGTNSSASGIATMYVNGSNTAARVNLSFSGLTSGQTNSYIRYGITGGIGTELRPNMGIGQLVDVPWNIIPVGTLSGQNLIDSLNEIGGKWAYTNIGTGNYPSGEIQGTWRKYEGSGTFTPPAGSPAIPPLTGDDLARDVSRFLTQATFGPKKAEIDALVNSVNTTYAGDRIAAYNAWIDSQFALDQTLLWEYNKAADRQDETLRGLGPYGYYAPSANCNHFFGWWTISVNAHDQLRQRYAAALSEIIVISHASGLTVRPYGPDTFYDMLGASTSGNFRTLLEDTSKHPAMGEYLSSISNSKRTVDAQGNTLTSPDENYAREILQLFSVGLLDLNPDGTLKLDAGGQAIQTYTQQDIAELARVFTGWGYSKRPGAAADGYPPIDNTTFYRLFSGGGPERHFQYEWIYPMKNYGPTYHDTGAKTVLGSAIPAGLDGEADLDAALDIIFNHPNTGPFIARRLIQRLVTSNPSAGYIYRVAQKFANNGSGVRGDMKAVIKAILLDYEARDLSVTNNVSYGKLKEPLMRMAQLFRSLDGGSKLPISNLNPYSYPATQFDNFPASATHLRFGGLDTRIAQTPQSPPSVFNWFLPDYNPGGDIGAAGLVAPEMQITSESTTFRAINYFSGFTYTSAAGNGGIPVYNDPDPKNDDVVLTLTPLVSLYDSEISAGKTIPQALTTVLDYLDLLLLGGDFKPRYASAPAPNPRSRVIEEVSAMSTATTLNRMENLLYLVMASSDFADQK